MADTQKIGREAEQLARRYLEDHGLRFKDANFSCKHGEIDLIMKDQETYVFVEVRKRKHQEFGEGAATVQHSKQHKIMQAATYYLITHHLFESAYCRFDVISIDEVDQLTWIPNAFERDYSRWI